MHPASPAPKLFSRDILLIILFAFSGMGIGIAFPQLAGPLAWAPRAGMAAFLFLCFIAVDLRQTWQGIKAAPGLIFYLVLLKLFLLPVMLWLFYLLINPEYALAGMLLASAPIGVVVPMFCLILGADVVLTLVGLVVTTLLLPLSMPLLAKLALDYSGSGAMLRLPWGGMTLTLLLTIAIPLAAAEIMRRACPCALEAMRAKRQGVSLFFVFITAAAIFSRYSEILLQDLLSLLTALGFSCLSALFCFVVTAVLTWRFPLDKQLSFLIGCVGMNNVLALIISAEFFTVREALMAAFYQIPFFIFPLIHRAFRNFREQRQRA